MTSTIDTRLDSDDSFEDRSEELRKMSLKNQIDLSEFNNTFNSLMNPK